MSFSWKYEGPGEKGFTLVELAVVLVILGAIFMSVFKVESMIRNAKIRQVINQYREFRSATLVYKDKYGYLPGDDPKGSVHVNGGNGDGDGLVDNNNTELYGLFRHLSNAGFISGSYVGASTAKHIFGDNLVVMAIKISDVIYNNAMFYNLPADVAQALDNVLDDGLSNTGNVQAGGLSVINTELRGLLPAISYESYKSAMLAGNSQFTLIKME